MKPNRIVARLPLLLPLLFVSLTDLAQAQRADTVRLAVEPQIELLTIVHRPAGEGPHPVVPGG